MCPILTGCPIFTPIVRIRAFLANRIHVVGRRFVQVDIVQVIRVGDVDCNSAFICEVLDNAVACIVERTTR